MNKPNDMMPLAFDLANLQWLVRGKNGQVQAFNGLKEAIGYLTNTDTCASGQDAHYAANGGSEPT